MDFPAYRPLAAALILAMAGCADASDEAPQAATPPTAAATATAEPVDQSAAVRQQYAQLVEMQTLAERCQWLAPIDALAVSLTTAERRDRLVADGVADALLESDLTLGKTKGERFDCASKEAADYADAVGYAAWQMRVTWALRGYSLLPGEGRPDWFKGRSPVEQHRAALEEAHAGLQARFATSINQARPKLLEEAGTMLALACPGNGEPCPRAEGDGNAAEEAYASAWLEHVEAYADALAGVEDKVGQPPGDG